MSPPGPSYVKTGINTTPECLAAVDEFASTNGWTRSHAITHLLPLGIEAATQPPAPILSTSGAAFVMDDAHVGLAMQAGHAVVATGGTVTVQGETDDGTPAAILFDLDRGRLAVIAGAERHELELDGPGLAGQVEGLGQSLAAVRRRAAAGPIEGHVIGAKHGPVDWIGTAPEGSGITVSGITVRVAGPAVLYVLAAEMTALMARWLRRQSARIQDLQEAFAASPEPVEVQR